MSVAMSVPPRYRGARDWTRQGSEVMGARRSGGICHAEDCPALHEANSGAVDLGLVAEAIVAALQGGS